MWNIGRVLSLVPLCGPYLLQYRGLSQGYMPRHVYKQEVTQYAYMYNVIIYTLTEARS